MFYKITILQVQTDLECENGAQILNATTRVKIYIYLRNKIA